MSGSNLIIDGLKVGESNPLPVGALSRIDSNNSTATPLSGSATYTGTWTEVLDFVELLVRCEADVAGTLYFETSNDGVNLSGTAVQVNAGTGSATFALPQFALTGRYYRLRYVNGSDDQTTFELYPRLNRVNTIFTTAVSQTVNDYTRALATRAVTDPHLDEVLGKQSNRSIEVKFGSNPDVGAGTEEAIWYGGGAYPGFLTTAKTVRIKAGGERRR